MAYTPPAGDNIAFVFSQSYSAPSGDAIEFNFSGDIDVTVPEGAILLVGEIGGVSGDLNVIVPEAAIGIAGQAGGRINLIPLSRVREFEGRATPRTGADQFAATLRDRGVNVTLRRSKGSSCNAACGQLRAGALADDVPDSAPADLSKPGEGL